MCMLDTISAKRDEIRAAANRHKAERLWVFGSCARKEERPDSDVDFIVDFAPHATVFDYVDIQDSLSGILGRKVDVVDSFVLGRDSRFTRQVLKERVAI